MGCSVPFRSLVIPSSLAQQSSCRRGTDHLGIIIALWRFRMASRSRASEYRLRGSMNSTAAFRSFFFVFFLRRAKEKDVRSPSL